MCILAFICQYIHACLFFLLEALKLLVPEEYQVGTLSLALV